MSRPTLSNLTAHSVTVMVDGRVSSTITNARDVIETLTGSAFTDCDGVVWLFARSTSDFEIVPQE